VRAAPDISEPTAFAGFYDEALPRIYGYFLRRCGRGTAVAEDLTQETFLAAVAELRKGRRVDAPMPWIYGIARHKLIDHYRSEARQAEATAVEEAVHEPQSEERDRVLAALRAVPPPQRAALVLRHMEGLSVPELASVLGRSVEAAESLLARGRVGFRRAYGEEAS
jgi:RNA polymerase sigma-70 factor, ECF subfamily